MTKLRHIRAFIHGLCVSSAMMGLTGDVLLNPHLYGEYVSWTTRSTAIAGTVLAFWLIAIGITHWIERRTPEKCRHDASEAPR